MLGSSITQSHQKEEIIHIDSQLIYFKSIILSLFYSVVQSIFSTAKFLDVGSLYNFLSNEIQCAMHAIQINHDMNASSQLFLFSGQSTTCYCPCEQSVAKSNSTTNSEPVKHLDKDKLSITRRRRTCADDPRMSSQALGIVAGMFLGTICLTIIGLDISKCIHYKKYWTNVTRSRE